MSSGSFNKFRIEAFPSCSSIGKLNVFSTCHRHCIKQVSTELKSYCGEGINCSSSAGMWI